MGYFFHESMNLYEMEMILEDLVVQNVGPGKFVSDVLPLDADDYTILSKEIESLPRFKSDITYYDQYRLVIMIAMIFSFRYSGQYHYYRKLHQFIERQPQHRKKLLIEILSLVFEEYGIDTFNENHKTIDGIYAVAAIHGRLLRPVNK